MNSIITDHSTAVLEEPTIKPLHDRLLVRRLAQQAKSGLLWIPDIAMQNSQRAQVLAIGEKVRGVNPGDEVLLPGIAAKYPDWESCDCMLIQVADIGGVFEPYCQRCGYLRSEHCSPRNQPETLHCYPGDSEQEFLNG